MPKSDRTGDMMKTDLAAARTAWIKAAGSHVERDERENSTFLAYTDDAGRFADFHALRHSFISNLVAGGVHPKTAQSLARHSTIKLTMDRYAHLRQEDLAGALDMLPDLSSARQAAIATGTDGRETPLSPSLPPKGGIRCNSTQLSANETERTGSDESTGKAEENSTFSDDLANAPGRIRTCDRRIRNPLLYPTELRVLDVSNHSQNPVFS
jgi:hypothetical protein